MKNENTSFGVLSAIVIAGVILACFPPANASDLDTNTANASSVAASTAPEAGNVASPSSIKSETCATHRHAGRKLGPKTENGSKSPAV